MFRPGSFEKVVLCILTLPIVVDLFQGEFSSRVLSLLSQDHPAKDKIQGTILERSICSLAILSSVLKTLKFGTDKPMIGLDMYGLISGSDSVEWSPTSVRFFSATIFFVPSVPPLFCFVQREHLDLTRFVSTELKT